MASVNPKSDPTSSYTIAGGVFPTCTRNLKHLGSSDTLQIKSTPNVPHHTPTTSIAQRVSWRKSRTIADAQMEISTLVRARISDYDPLCQHKWTYATERSLGSAGTGYEFNLQGRTLAWSRGKTESIGDLLGDNTECWRLIEFENTSPGANLNSRTHVTVAIYSQTARSQARKKCVINFIGYLPRELEMLAIVMVLAIAAEDNKRRKRRILTEAYTRTALMGNW